MIAVVKQVVIQVEGLERCANILFGYFFADNCMKMKNLDQGGHWGCAPPWIGHNGVSFHDSIDVSMK